MGFFKDLFAPDTKSSDPYATEITLRGRSVSDIRRDIAADQDTDGFSAVQVSAMFACARAISEGIGQVPCLLQRRTATGGLELALDHPLFNLLTRQPNSYQSSVEFRECLAFRAAITGNAYAFVARDHLDRPIELIPLPESAVTVEEPSFGEVRYRLNVSGAPVYDNRSVWHIKGPSWTGVKGLSVQRVAARALGLASDLEAFGSNLFRNGAQPSGLLTSDKSLSSEAKRDLAEAWNREQAGVENAHRTVILSDGFKFQPIQTTADDAQFIEARRYQTEEICRMMRVDPLMVGQATDSASYASIEQRFLAHLTHTLSPWYARIEASAEAALLTPAEIRSGYRVHFDTRSLMKGSAADRASYLTTMKTNGLMTTNECRDFEGLDRIDDPEADKITPAVNLYGPDSGSKPSE